MFNCISPSNLVKLLSHSLSKFAKSWFYVNMHTAASLLQVKCIHPTTQHIKMSQILINRQQISVTQQTVMQVTKGITGSERKYVFQLWYFYFVHVKMDKNCRTAKLCSTSMRLQGKKLNTSSSWNCSQCKLKNYVHLTLITAFTLLKVRTLFF